MAPSKDIILAFDLYGTLVSTASIASELEKHLDKGKAEQVATTWRTLQLEFTWRLNSMDQFQPFDTVTASALTSALATHSLSLPPTTISSLLLAYSTSLHPYPDTLPFLSSLSQPTTASSSSLTFHPYIFSNGTPTQLSSLLTSPTSLNPPSSSSQTNNILSLFPPPTHLISASSVRKFKPAPAVYWHLVQGAGKTREEAGDVWLVSGNAFDVVGARSLGLRAVWVDREGGGWKDGLVGGEEGRPDVVVGELGEVVRGVERWVEEERQNRG